jgi:hypothetical protein
MQFQKVPVSALGVNPRNPRIIRDAKFKKLVQSVRSFPQMLDLRPIVVDADMMVLGGNMRLRACIEAGFAEVPIIKASDLTEEQKAEFIIKDNVGFGEWDWEALANEWEAEQLDEWGLDVPFAGHEANEMSEDDLDMEEEFDPIGVSAGLQRVTFIFDGPEEAESYLTAQRLDFKKYNNAWQVNLSTRSTL